MDEHSFHSQTSVTVKTYTHDTISFPHEGEETDIEASQAVCVDEPKQDASASSLLLEVMYFNLSINPTKRCMQLFGEATMLTLIALLVPFFLGLEQGGIIAMFLLATSLSKRMQFFLNEHRDNVWNRNMKSWKAHVTLASSTSSMFLGIILTLVGFVSVLHSLGMEAMLQKYFAFLYQTSSLQLQMPLHERFGSVLGILFNNSMVLITTLVLTLLYRNFGLILILCWSAFVWAVALTSVFYSIPHNGACSGSMFVLAGMAAVLPHLLLETIAYTLAAMAALFLSKAFTKYDLTDARFINTKQEVGRLVGYAFVFLTTAALIESFLPSFLLCL